MAKASTTFQPGHPKVGGRKLKSKNKITRDIAALMNKMGENPIEGMIIIAQDPEAPLPIRARMHESLAKYVHPQLRSVEISGKDGQPIEVNYVSATEQLRSGIARVAGRKPAERTPSGD